MSMERINRRLISLEADSRIFDFGVVRSILTDGTSKLMLWTDALEMALCGDISGVESDVPLDQPLVGFINRAILDRKEV